MSKEDFKARLTEDMSVMRKEYKPDMGQKELSKKLKTSRQTICNIECGRYSPSVDMIYDWADATGHTVEISFKPKPAPTA